MLRALTAALTAVTVLVAPSVAGAAPQAQSIVPAHLTADLGGHPAIWNDAGLPDLTIESTPSVAAAAGQVVALFAPGVTPADHDLGAGSALGALEAAGIAKPASMPADLADALRRIPTGTDLTFAGIAAGTPGQTGIPGGAVSTAGAPGGADEEGCDDPNLCEYVWITIQLIGMGFKCYGPSVFGVCLPPSPMLPKFEYSTTQDLHIIRNDGGSDRLTVSPIHFKNNRGDDWSSNFIVQVLSFDQPDAGASYIGSSTGHWSPVSESFGIPPSITVNPTATLISSFCSLDTVRYPFGSTSRIDGFQLNVDVLMGVNTGSSFTFGVGYCAVA